ncbi:glycosyltransferase [Autumnicola psychrophila]|uniref:Glycosyltransferase n=1 Tax=Autumnicola psychrophila TaxID=3075592 RepID=A0ABU3DUQ0_9FLAO|nr:glycosyltransferase [Zunongwangia sp. F225]MDT0687444.1 glycosyltransferase [Zunongwangia sp. F225]
MKHFLCTRFNLRNENWVRTKKGEVVLTPEWLSQRYKIFMDYCVPSVINQTNRNFTWLIFFDIHTPQDFKNSINNFASDTKAFQPLYIDGVKNLQSALKNHIIGSIDEWDSSVITSRLDNDDALHKDFIDTIQNLAQGQKRVIIDVIRGYQMNTGKQPFEIRKHFKYYNPFISLVESVENLKGVYSRDHYKWSSEKNIIAYRGERLWLEIVHERNMINDVKNQYYLTTKFKGEDFGLKPIKTQDTFYTHCFNLKLRLKKLYKKIKSS